MAGRISFAQQNSLMNDALELMRDIAPKDTENLADNALNLRYVGDYVWEIYVDENIADYMKYTNESWSEFAEPLNGKQNPNEGWWHVACQEAMRLIANRLKGKLET